MQRGRCSGQERWLRHPAARVANPVRHRAGNNFGDARQRLVAMLLDQFDQPFLAKFAEFVFRFGDTVTVGDENIAGLHHQVDSS